MEPKLNVIQSALAVHMMHHTYIKMIVNSCTCSAHHVYKGVTLSSVSNVCAEAFDPGLQSLPMSRTKDLAFYVFGLNNNELSEEIDRSRHGPSLVRFSDPLSLMDSRRTKDSHVIIYIYINIFEAILL